MPRVLGDRPSRPERLGDRGPPPRRHHPVGRPGLGVRAGRALHRPGGLRAGRPGARDLLRPSADGPGTRRRGRGDRAARVRRNHAPGARTRRAAAGSRAAGAGVDEPRRRCNGCAARFPGHLAHGADRGGLHGGSRASPVLGAVPPRGRAHAEGHRGDEAVPLRGLRSASRVDAGERDRAERCGDQVTGRRRRGPVRALGRGGLGRGGPAGPQGGRRPAHVRVRRHGPAPRGRARAGRGDLRPPLPCAARAREGRGPVPREARRRHRPRGQAQAHRRASSSASSRRWRTSTRGRGSWSRARSTPT